MSDQFGARSFEARSSPHSLFFAQAARFRFASSILSDFTCDGPAQAEFPDDDYIRLQVCLSGAGRTSAGRRSVDVDASVIVCSPADAVLEFGPSIAQLALRPRRSALEKDVTTLLGKRPKNGVRFDLSANARTGQSARLRQLITQAATIIDCADEPVPTPILNEMDQTIRLATLYGLPNNASDLLNAAPKTSAPWQVKRIEEWLDANWKEDVTLEKLADITGASVRSIFATFKRARGYTPMTYLKKVRLKAAREMLLAAEPSASVTAICFACGFMNPGHFARDYKREFGELPSLTLQRGKSRG